MADEENSRDNGDSTVLIHLPQLKGHSLKKHSDKNKFRSNFISIIKEDEMNFLDLRMNKIKKKIDNL